MAKLRWNNNGVYEEFEYSADNVIINNSGFSSDKLGLIIPEIESQIRNIELTPGPPGKDGKVIFSELTEAERQLLKGEKGDKGEQGVSITSVSQPNANGVSTITFSNGDTSSLTLPRGPKGDTGDTGRSIQFTWSGTQLGIRQQGETSYTYTNLRGERGPRGEQGERGQTGASVEYNWDGTRLGIRYIGESDYDYRELKGERGEGLKIDGYATNTSGLPSPYTGGQYLVDDTLYYSNGSSWIKTTPIRGEPGPQGEEGPEGPRGPAGPATADSVQWQNVIGAPTALPADGGDADTLAGVPGSHYARSIDLEKKMSISGGILEDYQEKAVYNKDGTIDLSQANVFYILPTEETTLSIINEPFGVVDTRVNSSFTLIIGVSRAAPPIIFPGNILWDEDNIPDLSIPSSTYVLTFTWDPLYKGKWLGFYGGRFT